ncbi:Sid-1-related C precursor [Tribolium castaneum]|uniref:Sid-1-related C n=1 Tax=Tribolium castaneum TaxID=7070 RepID=A7YFW2_TRICA|nr:Sid-1-related C precursor [Tribolium castaneum]ABU63674.1 Sid-1-related C [Tribolium castaneum]|eukprot:NP_001099128.1 Sid-1-related C precursor [Tribolium castaneum]
MTPKMLHLFLIMSAVTVICDSFNPIYLNLSYSNFYTFSINKSVEYILEFSAPELKYPPRVTINSSDAQIKTPLMVVARQPKELLSWQLPMVLESDTGNHNFTKISRTLCHDMYRDYASRGITVDSPIVSVSTAAPRNVTFTVQVDYQKDFFIKPSVKYNFNITPSEPRFYFYNFTANITESPNSNYETVILEVFSDDFVCMTVSIQNASCLVFDTNQDITFRGFYETVNTQGGITIPKYKFPYGFFAVFVAKPDDSDCTGIPSLYYDTNRTKTITLIVKPSISYQDYVNAVIATLSSIGIFYFVLIAGFIFCSKRGYVPRQMEYVSSEPATPSTCLGEEVDEISLDETEYDVVSEADQDKSIRLGKSVVYLSDLARKDPRVHKYKSYLYLYNVLTVALFYGLPVIQLVVTYQRALNETGQQDLCYYNFLCAHPLGVISDFNHVFSNSGYVLLGLLFLGITYRREITHKDLNFERQYGIPQHYGMFYAMGVALIMEGVLSGSYHVCPNTANFQFDSSFMYVMAVLCMVKLYQNRHPDINATAYATFGVLAVAILLGMIGILEGNLYFWIVFTIIYLLSCFYLSIQIYYMGCWKLDAGLAMRVWRICVYEFWSGPLNVIKPIHKARMCLLIIANLCNWGMAFWGVYKHQKDFALFLLAIFMGNTLLYFSFYIVMKIINKERVNKLSLFFLSLSVLCAISAMYFFLNKSISWSRTPAQSRQFNQECKLLRFYDFHDIWHFLSAIGMFFTFMVLLTLDDDLSHTHRNKIVVF